MNKEGKGKIYNMAKGSEQHRKEKNEKDRERDSTRHVKPKRL